MYRKEMEVAGEPVKIKGVVDVQRPGKLGKEGKNQIGNLVNKYYIKILQKLCRRKLKAIGYEYPTTLPKLIEWHDFMAIQCIDSDNEVRDRVLGICVQTSNELEKLISCP